MNLKMWIYGAPFSGKTYFASTFPKPFVISTDGNAQFYTDDYVQVDTIEQYLRELDNFINKPNDYETLIIDVAEHVFEMVREYYLDKANVKYEGDANDHGKTWKLVRLGFIDSMKKIRTIQDKNVILISHERVEKTTDVLGMEHTKYMPMIDDTKENIHGTLMGYMHLVGRVYTEDVAQGSTKVKKHFLSFGSTGDELSGVRIPLKQHKMENTYDDLMKNIGKGE